MPAASSQPDGSPPTQKNTRANIAGGKRKREEIGNSTSIETSGDDQETGGHTEQLQHLFKDVIHILQRQVADMVKHVIEEIRSKVIGSEASNGTQRKDVHHPDIVRAVALRQEFDRIILRELIQRPSLMALGNTLDHSPKVEDGTMTTSSTKSNVGDPGEVHHNTVLTLFGGSGQPKQLFASLKESHLGLNHEDTKMTDIGLPNGISFTKIVPVHSEASGDNQKTIPTIGQLFAPPPSIQSLNPPRQSRHTATRSSSVNWYNPTEAAAPSRPNRRDSYTTQPLTTGQWLTYNITPSSKDLSSPELKRKQRDRALSFGEPQTEPSEHTRLLHQQAKEDALFRSIYSGFAPDRDNAGALVSEHSKNRLWWKRLGERRHQLNSLWNQEASGYDDNNEASNAVSTAATGDEEVPLQEAVEIWTPEETPAELKSEDENGDTDSTTKGIDELLRDVSELLETLNSYQDVRNLSLANTARTSAIQNTQLSAMTGTPTSPSSDELSLYNMLKSQLAILVASLPPFALAKLDGQKLGVLNVNTKIQTETKNCQGSLEEDEISTKGRQPAVVATAPYSSRASNAGVNLAPRNNYLSGTSTPAALSHRPTQVPQTMPARSMAGSSYLPNQQYSTRPPSGNQYFASNARPPYSTQRPVSGTPDRYPYSTSQQYGQQSARQSYGNGYNPYSSQNGGGYGQGYAHSQQPAASSRQPSYAQTSRPSQSYNYTPSAAGGYASPAQVAAQYSALGTTQADGTPSRARPALPNQHSGQYAPPATSSPQINGTGSVSATTGTQGQQAQNGLGADVNRQKSQLAEEARRSSIPPQAVGTGQAESGQKDGTSTEQVNGVART
ncbi:MAG: hypothetical protein LQ352_006541 [Teloschistes flavicans]|nr:MAG: hypothetical protein LQ352_006541 [Teloschistes flavicans]